MATSRFKIVFDKLSEVAPAEGLGVTEPAWILREEIDELAELRRLALELAEPETQSYTVT